MIQMAFLRDRLHILCQKQFRFEIVIQEILTVFEALKNSLKTTSLLSYKLLISCGTFTSSGNQNMTIPLIK